MSEPPRPKVGVIAIVFRDARAEEVLIVMRGQEPAKGIWAFPSGKVEWGETMQEAGLREVREETGVPFDPVPEESLAITQQIGRDGEGRVIYHFITGEVVGVIQDPDAPIAPADDIEQCRWCRLDELDQLEPAPDRLRAILARRLADWRATLRAHHG